MGSTIDDEDDFTSTSRQNWRARLEERSPSAPAASTPEPAALAPMQHEPDEIKEPTRRKKEVASTAPDFTGPSVPLQVKLPQDLVQSLKLHAIANNETMSDIVFRALTSEAFVGKAWISTRRSA